MTKHDWFHAHAHSHYSVLDGMPSVVDMVEQAAKYGQPAIALTDHGNISGVGELYRTAKQYDIKAFPGSEFYYVKDVTDKTSKRYHLTILAFTNSGYQGLIKLSSQSQSRDNYHYKPRIDIETLASLSLKERNGMAVLSGCYFGLLAQTIVERFAYSEVHLTGTKPSQQEIIEACDSAWKGIRQLFDQTFVELQLHNIKGHNEIPDIEMMNYLNLYAWWRGSNTIITQDSHYLSVLHQNDHNMMKRLGYKSGDEMTFPGGPYHLARTSWIEKQWRDYPEIWKKSLVSMEQLLDSHDLHIGHWDSYTYRIPHSVDRPNTWLRKKSFRGLKKLGLTSPRYRKQLDHELDIIGQLGMANYFHLIYRGVQFCHQNGIYVGARGSANGSLVCYALDITQVDPVKWNLMFERFLSLDRIKPPDIDLDIEGTRREEVIEFYRRNYDVMQIGTYGGMGLSLDEGRGSIMVSYIAWLRSQGRTDELAKYKTLFDLPTEIQEELVSLSEHTLKRNSGAHAAGFALGTDDFSLDEHMPKMLIPSSGHMVTQYTMDEVEIMGVIKIDLLGQRTLTTLKRVLELTGHNPDAGIEWIPMNDSRTLSALRHGVMDNGIFQFEGWAAARGCRELPVKSVKDCIAIMALYRPAVMKGYLEDYLKVRHGKSKVKYVHPMLESILKETHGIIIFQEQIMTILREVGIPYEELNQFLSALKMSNHKTPHAKKIFRRQRQLFIQQCQMSKGMSKADADSIWDYVAGFAEYGFNRAHATAYGILGYRMAYLKTHYTLEFMAALLETTAGTEKEAKYVKETRRLGLRIIKADVNSSGALWSLDTQRKAIRRGLTSLKGVGLRAANEIADKAPYASIQDLIERTENRAVTGGVEYAKTGVLKGVMKHLEDGGALKELA